MDKMGFHRLGRGIEWEGRLGREKHTTVDLIITRVSACAPGARLEKGPTFPDVAAT